MTTLTADVATASQIMTHVEAGPEGLEVVFLDGLRGRVPYADIPEIGCLNDLVRLELPNSGEIILGNKNGDETELPWDFVRSHCDPTYRPRMEAFAAKQREALGRAIRERRESAGLTQEQLASAAGIGRVTLVRIEHGEQSPRYETLLALSEALGLDRFALHML